MTRRAVWMLTISGLLVSSAGLFANLAVPPPGHAGAPSEDGCDVAGCHDSPDTSWVMGLDVRLHWQQDDPSRTVFTVYTSDYGYPGPFGLLHGFQATVLDSAANPVGEIVLIDTPRTQVVVGTGGRIYVGQTAAGAETLSVQRNSWHFAWIEPEGRRGTVTVYASGLLANGDSTRIGDLTQTTFYTLPDCFIEVSGDVNESGSVTSADIIYLLGYIFKGDIPAGPCPANGDVNCDAVVTTADVIYLVNHIFKGMQPPCDICELVYDNVWWCP